MIRIEKMDGIGDQCPRLVVPSARAVKSPDKSRAARNSSDRAFWPRAFASAELSEVSASTAIAPGKKQAGPHAVDLRLPHPLPARVRLALGFVQQAPCLVGLAEKVPSLRAHDVHGHERQSRPRLDELGQPLLHQPACLRGGTLYGGRRTAIGQSDRVPHAEALFLAQGEEFVGNAHLLIHVPHVPSPAETDVQLKCKGRGQCRGMGKPASEPDHSFPFEFGFIEPTQHPQRRRARGAKGDGRGELEGIGEHPLLLQIEQSEAGVGLADGLLELAAIEVRVGAGVPVRLSGSS